MAMITRLFNDRPRTYDRDLLEAAWLMLADVTETGMAAKQSASRRLAQELGFDQSTAFEYVIVASNWDGRD